MSNQPNADRIALGELSGTAPGYKPGLNENVPNTGFVTLWEPSGRYPYFDPDVIEVKSSDAGDTFAGAGAQSLALIGLGEDFRPLTELVAMTGTSVALSNARFARLFPPRVVNTDIGATDIPAGNIGTITCSVAGVTVATIAPGANRSLMSTYTVPDDHTLLMSKWQVSTRSPQEVDARLVVREPGSVFEIRDQTVLNASQYILRFPLWLRVPERSDIEIQAKANSAMAKVSGGFQFRLVDNQHVEFQIGVDFSGPEDEFLDGLALGNSQGVQLYWYKYGL